MLSVAKKNVSLLFGKGDGTFNAPVVFASGLAKKSLIAADLNGDGAPDLAALGAKTVNVLLNDGHGVFAAPAFFAAGAKPGALVAGDFREDRRLDLAVLNGGAKPAVTLLAANDHGSVDIFAPVPFGKGAKPASFVAADLTGDGHLDVAAIIAKGQLAIRPGNAFGGFRALQTLAAGTKPVLLGVGDLNDDLQLDAIALTAKKIANVLVNTGGVLGAPSPTAPNFKASAFVVCDINHDGDMDLIAVSKKDKFKVALGATGTGLDPL